MFAATLIGKRYLLHEEIGKGGMGVVYRATDRLTGNIVALKKVTTPSGYDPFATRVDEGAGTAGNEFRLALAQEFQMLSSLRHPNIISVLDYGFDAYRQPYFTMDYLENARHILDAAAKQPIAVKMDLLLQILHAIAYLHRRNVFHRDVKPLNVLVQGRQLKVLDFGLAIAKEQQKMQQPEAAGTLAYMAPEVLQGGHASAASDLYAVGMIAYEMFGGRYPYDQNDFQRMLHDILHKVPDVERLDIDESLQLMLARMLAKDAAARPQTAAEVIQQLNRLSISGRQTITIETAAIRESFLQAAQFVGRAAEFARLMTALDRMLMNKGSTWLVGGESGVGKTRLLDELRTRGLVKGAFVLRGQNISNADRPYEMWRDVLRRLALQVDLLEDEAAVLKDLVPDIAALIERNVPDPPELNPEAAQERLITVITSLFRSQAYPILLIFEDMHWAGSESIAVLQQLNTAVSELPLMIVASYRDEERRSLPTELPQMEVITLTSLSREEIAELTESMIGEAGRRARVVDFIERETEGNIFFMVEVMRALADEYGDLDQIGLRTLPRTVVAGGIQLVVRRRLNRVPEEAWRLLQAAAIAGRELDLDILRALIANGSIPFTYNSLERWLTLCAEIAVLAVQHERWRFAHDKLRDGLLETIADEERPTLHRHVAQAVESVYFNDMARAAVLAYHWGMVGDAEKTAHYATAAALQSIRSGAGAQAKAFFEQAIDAANRLSDTPEHQRMMVDIAMNLGRVALYFANNDFARLLTHALQASEHLQDEERIARIYGAAGTYFTTRGQVGDGLNYFGRSMMFAEKLGIEELLLMPYNNIGRAVLISGDLPKAETMLARGIRLAEKFNDADMLAGSLAWYAYALALQGKRDQAIPHVTRSIEITAQMKEPAREITNLTVRGSINYHCGRLEEAQDDLLRAQAMAEALNGDILLVNILGTLGCVCLLKGDIATATDHLNRCLFLGQKMNAGIGLPDFMARRAEIDLLNGKLDEALALAQRALALAEGTRQNGIKSVVMRVLANIYAAQADYEKAETLLKNSIANSEPGNVQTFIAISRLDLARLYNTMNRKDEARALLQDALTTFEQIEMTYYCQQAKALQNNL
jgi:tetratricopeptide (TPR) repeat protein/tRNA A-37 threonylcarbamoyl transferase component Bud32